MSKKSVRTKLWILKPSPQRDMRNDPWDPWYDRTFAFVVRAGSESQARRIASKDCGEEGANAWLSPLTSTCLLLSESGDAGVIVSDTRKA